MGAHALIEPPRASDTFRGDARLVYACRDVAEGLAGIPDGAVQLVVSSPPYNIGKAYERRAPLEAYLAQMQPVLESLVRVLSPQGSLCWQVGNYVEDGEVFPLDIYFYPAFKRLGMQLRNRIVWHFDHGLHCTNRLSGRYETLLWLTKSSDYVFNLDPIRVPSKYPGKLHYKGPNKGQPSGNPLGKNPSDIWRIVAQDWETGLWNIPNVKSNHPEKSIHPCQFPIELVQRCVLAFSNEDDWVLDPYAGVGSTLIAALMHGRRAAGFDLEPAYLEEGKRRIEQYYAGVLKVRPIGKPVYKPSGREKVAQVPGEWSAAHAVEAGELF